MKTLAFPFFLLLCAFAAFGQSAPAPEPSEKAPPGVDDALHARVNKFYSAFMAGKFKEAYLLVADDSQDKFFELAKDQYRSCEIIKTAYTENFTKATVVTSCKSDWRWHGAVTLATFPLTSTWALVDGQWYWHFVKPTMVPNPFSPTGYTPLPPDTETDNTKLVPSDIPGAGKSILSKVGIDKSSVQLLSNQQSEAVVHLRNDMPGEVSATLDQPNIPGLTVSLGQSKLRAHETTTILFKWSPGASATPVNTRQTVQVRVEPTGQVFPISLVIASQNENPSQTSSPFKK